MTLFLTMLPLYLFGNLHCLGMCGPLVMMIGYHKFRNFYYLGRMLSYGIAGMIAGEVGAVLNILFNSYHIPAMTSFLFGLIILISGLYTLRGRSYPGVKLLSSIFGRFNKTFSLLMLRDQRWPTFLFGFFTVFLPCGQTLIVFSAFALYGDTWAGLFNGIAFAALTSPALAAAMNAKTLFKRMKLHYNSLLGASSILVSILAFCRGFAEIGWISHWTLNPSSPQQYHLVIF